VTVEFEALIVGAFSFAAVLIWNKIRIWSWMRAIETRLQKMQKEINILQMQESRRLVMELNANSKAEAPKIDPNDAPVEMGGGDVVRLMKSPPTTSTQ
jgi:DNA-directed RNA polymerase subunit H (RpoH/RPB5)